MHLERGALTVEYLERFLSRAAEVGVTEIGITEHMYRFRDARDILWDEYVASRCVNTAAGYIALIDQVRAAGLPVRFGLEADYVPGKEREIERVLGLFPLDYVIGSVHWLDGWAFDQSSDSWNGRSVESVYRQYYKTLGEAAASGLFDIIGHTGNIAYFGFHASDPLRAELEEEFLQRVAGLPVALEINSGGLLRPAKELFPRPAAARRVAEQGIPVTTGSDAHRPEDVGHDFPNLYRQRKDWGFSTVCGFAGRRKVTYPITTPLREP